MKTTVKLAAVAVLLACFASSANAQGFRYSGGGVNVQLGGSGRGVSVSGSRNGINFSGSRNGISFSKPSSGFRLSGSRNGVQVNLPSNILPFSNSSSGGSSRVVLRPGRSSSVPVNSLPKQKIVIRPAKPVQPSQPSTTSSDVNALIQALINQQNSTPVQPQPANNGLTTDQLAALVAALSSQQQQPATVQPVSTNTGLTADQLNALIAALAAAQTPAASIPAEFVGTWYEDAPGGNVYKYELKSDGSYDMYEFKKGLPMVDVLAVASLKGEQIALAGTKMTLSPGASQEGPFEVTSHSASGKSFLILTGGGAARVWRDQP